MAEERKMSRGAELLADVPATSREIADYLGVSPGLVGGWKTGTRRPSKTDQARIAAKWPQVPVESWIDPRKKTGVRTKPKLSDNQPTRASVLLSRCPDSSSEVAAKLNGLANLPPSPVLAASDSPLPPWLRRLIHDGVTGIDNDAAELERTLAVIAATLAEHPAMIADVLRALRKYA